MKKFIVLGLLASFVSWQFTGIPYAGVPLNNLEGVGQVTVSGQEWSARSRNEAQKIPVGTGGVVCAVSGVKLIVEPQQMQS